MLPLAKNFLMRQLYYVSDEKETCRYISMNSTVWMATITLLLCKEVRFECLWFFVFPSHRVIGGRSPCSLFLFLILMSSLFSIPSLIAKTFSICIASGSMVSSLEANDLPTHRNDKDTEHDRKWKWRTSCPCLITELMFMTKRAAYSEESMHK